MEKNKMRQMEGNGRKPLEQNSFAAILFVILL